MRYVALLRGVNVGGNTKVNMAELRASCERLGFENVKTYINSGNVIFDAVDVRADKLALMVHDVIVEDFDLNVSVMVRSVDELQRVIANNPFDGQFENHKDMHVFFLTDKLPDDKVELLLAQNSDEQLIAVDGRTVYCLLRISVVDSTLGKGFLDRKLKVPATARNWRTVKTLADM